MPGIGSYQVTIEPNARSWSSGYDRRLPSDGPGFNSRRTHVFSLALSRSLSLSYTLSYFVKKRKKKNNPGNRSRTSDLEISIVAIYSLPLCQLSYTRTYEVACGPKMSRLNA